MPTAVLDKGKTLTEEELVVREAIGIIQKHLDAEAGNRRQLSLQPKELCPTQQVALVEELRGRLRKR